MQVLTDLHHVNEAQIMRRLVSYNRSQGIFSGNKSSERKLLGFNRRLYHEEI
jgi:hypothetical protein